MVEELPSYHRCSYTHITTRYIKENESKDMPLLILSQRGSKFTRAIWANYNVL